MGDDGLDQYMTREARLASFQKNAKKRGSSASGRGKALAWPHKQIAPASLANAGFYFNPTHAFPDNVTCFLCGKGFDGWEAGDDPLLEHLKHASQCGWAVVAAIQAEVGDYAQQDPSSPDMIEARKVTFAGMWPHEGKKGWKCKTKQLVDAGWKYTPTAESDDMATCTYCELALDGWEPSDKPYDEHYNRSPECSFFILAKQFEGTRKKSRGKASRGSKASRLSVQSAASEALSAGDTTAVGDDSIVTTSSTTTQGGRKAKGKRGAAASGSCSKSKKNEPAEPQEAEEPEEQVTAPTKPAKSTRGKKRGSEAVDDASTSLLGAPVTKKRATRTRSSTVTNASTVVADDSEIADAPAPARKASIRPKNPGSSAKASRHMSALSTASVPSLREPADDFPDDEEIERQLEEDLARDSDEDNEVERHPEGATRQGSGDYAMFDSAEASTDNAAVEADLLALQEEMQVEQQQPQVLKKGRKANTRKASAQTKPKPSKAASPPLEEEEAPIPEPRGADVEEPHDETARSTNTVMGNAESEPPASTGSSPRRSSEASVASHQSADAQPVAKGGRGRPSKASLASRASTTSVELVEAFAPAVAAEQPKGKGRGRPPKSSLASQVSANSVQLVEPVEQPVKSKHGRPSKASVASRDSTESLELVKTAGQPAKETRGRPSKTSLASQASATVNESEAPPRRGRGRPAKKEEPMEAPPPPPPPAMAVDEVQADDLADVTMSVQAMQLEGERSSVSVAKEQEVWRPPGGAAQHLTEPRPTLAKVVSPAASARQAALSPSPSPQSSDAENHDPSSKPPAGASVKRVALAPVTRTPLRGSPAKRNVLAGLESSTPWLAVNLEAVLGTPEAGADKENMVGRILKRGKELTSPEKGMTVEEWIYFNAGEAEEKLKHECETMVSRFEREGTRAMNALEGLAVDQSNC